jgi:hypothetical protein
MTWHFQSIRRHSTLSEADILSKKHCPRQVCESLRKRITRTREHSPSK